MNRSAVVISAYNERSVRQTLHAKNANNFVGPDLICLTKTSVPCENYIKSDSSFKGQCMDAYVKCAWYKLRYGFLLYEP